MVEQNLAAVTNDIRPQVTLRKGNAAVWVFALALVVASGGLF